MSKRLFNRILCLLLAVQMLCTPLAQATEESPITAATPIPAAQSEPVETDTELKAEEERETDAPQTAAVERPYMDVIAGFGLSIHQKTAKRWFHLERPEGAPANEVSYGKWLTLEQQGDVWKITDLPTAAELGRMPDMRFAGWYGYKGEWPGNGKAYYDETQVGNEIVADMDISPETTGVARAYTLNLVARWLPSEDAHGLEVGFRPVANSGGTFAVADQPLTLYDRDIAGKTPAELETMTTVFDPEDNTKEYYLRVGAAVEAVDLSFLTQEPFAAFAADYEAAGNRVPAAAVSPVRVEVTTGDDTCAAGTKTDYTDRLIYEAVNGGVRTTEADREYWTANNSTEKSAHALWTMGAGATRSYPSDGHGGYTIEDSIPLRPSAGAGQYYNTVKVTVTAPDGVTTKTYTFHIQRLTDPVMALKPGNTPLGMVARDTAGTWGTTEEQRVASKKAATTYFKTYQKFDFAGGHWPADGVSNNNGRIYRKGYHVSAWPTVGGTQINYDLDETAIVVYEDRKFQEPGLVLYGSEGDQVTFGTGAGTDYESALERSYTLFLADKLTPDGVSAGAGTPGAAETITATAVDPAGADVLSLERKKVRPGVYTMEYAYTDPVSGETYDSRGTGFYRGTPEDFSRPLLVVPIPGDVDMDGAVTTADGMALKGIIVSTSSGLLGQASGDPGVALYLYRVCDVNGDGEVDQGDVDALLGGYRPRLSNDATNASDYFYLPLPLGEEPVRLPAPTGEEPEEADRAKLTLDYLGKNKASVTDAVDGSGGPVWDTTLDKESGLEVGDVFWVGVRLKDTSTTNGELYSRLVTSFTGTLTYDAKYIKPVAVLSEADIQALKDTGLLGNEQAEWAYTLRKYNVGKVSNAVWGNTNYEVTPGVDKGREYTAHYSKALTTLGGQGTSTLRETVFSVAATGGGNAFNSEGGYLLLVPFELASYPMGATEGSFVELGMGMQDFLFTTQPIMNGRSTSTGDPLTVAWSMQDEIFGGATQNARESMQYRGGSAVSLKLGEDTTDYTPLYNHNIAGQNAVYGEAFKNVGVVPFSSPSVTGLPSWLKYEGDTLSGIPEQAGIFTFLIGGKPYQLTVEKAPLMVTATSFAKYYGETFYCGENAADLIFTYNTTQIKPLDLKAGKPNTGTMADLAGLIGWDSTHITYRPPVCTAYAADTTAVDKYTVVGTYPVRAENGLATNYEFEYVPGTLEIKKRPIVVDELKVTSVGTIYHDSPIHLSDLAAQYAPPTVEFAMIGAPGLPTDKEGEYNGLPLTRELGVIAGDTLAIKYNVEYVQTEADKASESNFKVAPGATEPRNVLVSNIRLTDTDRRANYDLTANVPQKQTAIGNVQERSLTALEIYSFPTANRSYEYGQSLNIAGSGLIVRLISGEGQAATERYLTYSRDAYAQEGLKLTWVTREQMEAGVVGTVDAYHAQYLHVNEHNGKYLCVSKEWTQNGEQVVLKAYTDGAIAVTPRPLTLTMENQKRYYGEENAAMSFRYEVTELATWDKKQGLTGAMSELESTGAVAIRNYTKPTLAAVTALTGGAAVNKKTPVTNTDCYLTISGGSASDYTFRYAVNNGAEPAAVSDEMGWGTLRIYPRPIVVEEITKVSIGTIYADTYTTSLTGLRLTHSADGNAINDSYTTSLPAGAYHTRQGAAVGADPTPIEMALTGPAVVGDDIVALTYDADFVRENGKQPYFNMGDQGEKSRDVVVKNLNLDREERISSCYELAFAAAGDAEAGYPSVRKQGTEASAIGTLRRRPITALTILKAPNLSYVYGQEFTLYGMQVTIAYEDTYENDSLHNRRETILKLDSNGDQKKLDDLGLKAYYSDGTNLGEEVRLTGTYPTVKGTTGKRLVLSGQVPHAPTGAIPVVTSDVTGAIAVTQKSLTLTVEPRQYRFYGEPNGTYKLSVSKSNLALPDRQFFPDETLTVTSDNMNPTELVALSGYTPPSFQTEATPGKPVIEGGYELKLSGGGTDNYKFQYVPGRIMVLKRPIQVAQVIKDPVYTVYPASDSADAATRPLVYSAKGDQGGVTTARAGSNYKDSITVAETHSDNPLPMSDFGLYGTNKADFYFQVKFDRFPTDADLGGDTRAPWPVTISNVVLSGDAEKNYRLINTTPGTPNAMARVDKRKIDFIEVTRVPVLDQYTYGDTLDLSDLEIKITYKKNTDQPGEQVETEFVGYGERDNIYVNYRDTAELPGVVTDEIVNDHPANKSGNDHLTIAPVHGDPGFAANEKFLMVSARTHQSLPFVAPKLVGDKAIKVAPLQLTYTLAAEDKTYDGTTVAGGTLKLTNAYNKGGVTDVVYIPTGAAYENKGDTADLYTDFVNYVKTNGNGYAFPAGDAGLSFQFLYPNVRYGDAFHSTETPAALNADYWLTEPAAKVPGEAGWDEYGTVASMPVEVRNMVLAGPDARNYTWKSEDETQRTATEVLRTTRNEAEADQAAAPYATIEKATYAMPDPNRPVVAVDRHTNTAMVVMEQGLGADEHGGKYAAERHYEYALDTLLPGEGEALADRLADGTLAHQLGGADVYQDTRFFGGEPVRATVPDDYEPSEPPREPVESDVVKGQIYLWADQDPGLADEDGNPLRTPLPRDAFFWGRVRLAETHNYLPSPPRYSIEDDREVTTDSAALLAAATDAAKVAEDEVEALTAEAGKRPDKENKDIPRELAAAGKSYAQRLDIISTEQKRGTDSQEYQIDTLEAVWFTDVLLYPKGEVLDTVTRNWDPARYYGYFWDQKHSVALAFDKDPLDLTGPIEIEVERKDESGTTGKVPVTVNEGNIAALYVSTTASGDSIMERSIAITPALLDVPLGSDPVTLTVTFTPQYTSIKTIKWTSSDEKVAQVSSKGVVTFVGEGTAVITATSRNKKTAQTTVLVSKPEGWINPSAGIFDFYKTEAFFALDETGGFAPGHVMTRGEMAMLLNDFVKQNDAWTKDGTAQFPDVAGDEPYAEAARNLGQMGIVKGVQGGNFAAGNTITRAEFITLLARMMNVPITAAAGDKPFFKDCGKKDTWAWAYIDAMARLGVARGTGGGNFDPERPITKAEAAVFLSRLLRIQAPRTDWQPIVPTDVAPESWAYDGVIRAVNAIADTKISTAKP